MLGGWALRRRPIKPLIGLVWLSLWLPLVLLKFQARIVNHHIEKIGPARILADAEALLKQRQSQPETERWGAERVSGRDPRLGPALRELGFLYLTMYDDRLELKMDGSPESYEGIALRVQGVTPGPVDWSALDRWRSEPCDEGRPTRRYRTIAPGIEWLTWSHRRQVAAGAAYTSRQ